jgi:iron complex outermembrane receptor protein
MKSLVNLSTVGILASIVMPIGFTQSVAAESSDRAVKLRTGGFTQNDLVGSPSIPEEQRFAQADRAIAITAIRVNQTGAGVVVILETANGTLPQPSPIVDGNTLTAILSNAVLELPERQEFRAEDPVNGIASIIVRQLNPTEVQISVVGTAAVPTAEFSASDRRLTLNLSPATINAIRILVTAEKTPEDAQDVPLSLTVLDEGQIEDAQINTIRDVAANTPNFFTTVGDRVFNFYSVRGLGNSNFLIRDSVGYYLDDVPIEYFHQFFPGDLFDIERVEILRGPQNTLYGRNSIAGVVNIISRPPSEFLEFQLGAEYGTFNQRRFQASISDTIIPDTLGFRLSGVYSARDGFTENVFLDERANDQSDIAGRFNLVWTPSENWNVSLNVLGSSSQDGGATYVDVSQDNPFEIEENEIAELTLSNSAQSLRAAYSGDTFRFTSVTAHNDNNVGYRSDGDYTAQDIFRTDLEVSSSIWSQEFRLQSPEGAERFTWLIGSYIQNRQFDVNQQQSEFTRAGAALFGNPNVRFFRTFAAYDQTTLAAFGQVDFTPVDSLTLTAGLRYEYSRDDLERWDQTETFEGVVADSGQLTDSIDGAALLPRFAITYRFSPDAAIYGSITRGYRPVTLNYSIPDPALNNVRQESSWSYEVGFKSSWLDDRLIFNAAVFISEIDDYQVLLPNQQGFFTDITNAGVRTAGFELETRAIVAEGFELSAGFGYVNAEYTDYTNPFSGATFNGNRLTYAPEFTLNAAAQYRSPGGFFGRLELQGIGTYFFDDANTIRQDPFVLVNARVGYEFGNSGVYLFANNLFDQEYFTAAFAPFGVTRANFGDRRIVGVQFRTRF